MPGNTISEWNGKSIFSDGQGSLACCSSWVTRADSLEKILMPGKTEGKRRGWQRMRWLDSIMVSMDMNLSKLWEIDEDRGVWHGAVHGVAKNWARLSD